MIGTIRKHSVWLWWSIVPLTILSFVVYMGAGPSRNGGGRASGDFGSLYGHKVTLETFRDTQDEVYLDYFFRTGGWPNENPNISEKDLDEQIYVRLMLIQKAEDLGIYVDDKTVVTAANAYLRLFDRGGETMRFDRFAKQILQQKNLTTEDFKNYVRHSLAIEQLREAMGLTGALVTPQEVITVYKRQHQELSVQAVFFSASNYLSSVAMTPAAIERFYTNDLAEYRLPDRVQVNYVAFDATDFQAGAEQKLSKTNLNDQVETVYTRYGERIFPEAKTPDEKKARIRKELILQQALSDALRQAREFANVVFNQEPVRSENLAAIASQKGLTVRVTAPFSREHGPEESAMPESFVKAAFTLTTDEPFVGPVASSNAVFVLALDKQLPSEIPPLDQIRGRVTRDCQFREAILLARNAGTNFVRTLAENMAGGKSFASVCLNAGLQPQMLPAFSLSTRELLEIGDRVSLDELKQAAFTTPVGKTGNFEETRDGGFIVYVQSKLPVDEARMNSELPQYTAALRRERQNESFGQWINLEASRQLRTTPAFHRQTAPGAARAR
jgi:SurA N-terminal domain/PPIC-type PPIASE domain